MMPSYPSVTLAQKAIPWFAVARQLIGLTSRAEPGQVSPPSRCNSENETDAEQSVIVEPPKGLMSKAAFLKNMSGHSGGAFAKKKIDGKNDDPVKGAIACLTGVAGACFDAVRIAFFPVNAHAVHLAAVQTPSSTRIT